MKDQFDFEINEWFPNDHPLSPEEEFLLLQEIESEESAEEERQALLLCCASCANFIRVMAEAGLCKISNNCICKNPKAFIDMFDAKCDKWQISKEF